MFKKPYMIKNRNKPVEDTVQGYMGPLVCSMCLKEKDKSEFFVSNIKKGIRRCKKCCIKYGRKQLTNINSLINYIYGKQSYSCRRKDRKPCKIFYTKEQFISWINTQEKFFDLYKIWIESGTPASLRPTVGRKDSDKNYTIDNLLITVNKNMKNVSFQKKIRPVGEFTKNGTLLCSYSGLTYAAKELKGSVSHLCKSLKNSEKTYRGSYWRYLDNKCVY